MAKLIESFRRIQSDATPFSKHPSNLLLIQNQQPRRLCVFLEASESIQNAALRIYTIASESFFRINSSIFDVFCIDALLTKLKNTPLIGLCHFVFPYLAGVYLGIKSLEVQDRKLPALFSWLTICYFLFSRYTEDTRIQPKFKQLFETTLCVYALAHLHFLSFNWGIHKAQAQLLPLEDEKYISHDTTNNLSILAGIFSSCYILPQTILNLAKGADVIKGRFEKYHGMKSQSSKMALIPFSRLKELNTALIFYNHFTSQFKDPERLFQYFIVSLNVLKDAPNYDPDSQEIQPKKGFFLFLNKTRNVWLLAIDSFLKAKADYLFRTQEINHDRALNSQTFTVIRDGILVHHCTRSDLLVGDLVSLEQAIYFTQDPHTKNRRIKTALSGYLIQLKEGSLKQVALSLVELNGENHPLIILPSEKPKQKAELLDVDLFSIAPSSAILPGIEILSFDNSSHHPTSEGLFIQIAPSRQKKQLHTLKTPYSLKSAKTLKKTMIFSSLFFSIFGALPLITYQNQPNFKKQFQYFGTEFVDKFTQVFSEAQTIIPLVSEVVLEMVNTTLVKHLNGPLESKLTLNQALCLSDIFEYVRQKKLKIFSDKTGTVTENFMQIRNLIIDDKTGSFEKMLIAFATTFSDQKTEAEENEIARYFLEKHHLEITSNPQAAKVATLLKAIQGPGFTTKSFESIKLGLFTEFGGVFTLRIEKGKAPVCVFCGIPKDKQDSDLYFHNTRVLTDYQIYENTHGSNQVDRQDSLTRDWTIAETPLTKLEYERILKALMIKEPEIAHSALKEVLSSFAKNFYSLGVFQIDNPIKARAKDTIKKWRGAGIDFLLITGDTFNASKLVAQKLFEQPPESILRASSLHEIDMLDLSVYQNKTLIFTDTEPKSLNLMRKLDTLGSSKPAIIFCQMKDIDKKRLVDFSKSLGNFVIASGDGCNDILMFQAADIAIAHSAPGGSFARGVEEEATITDIQVGNLSQESSLGFYKLFDIHKGSGSQFLKKFSKLSNTQSKIITALMAKSLKNLALPRALGWQTKEIPGQFAKFLSYDGLYVSAIYQAAISTANTPLVDRPIHRSKLPYTVLISSIAIACLQSCYCYFEHKKQITSMPLLLTNLIGSIAGCFLMFEPPGYTRQHL